MSIAHDFVKLDDITYGLKGSKNSLEFEFSVLGTEEASVYFSPQPIGQFGFRRGYGVCKLFMKSDNNMSCCTTLTWFSLNYSG